MVPHPSGLFERSWADFDADGNLLGYSDAAAEHWLYTKRDGVLEPVEVALDEAGLLHCKLFVC